MKKNNSLWRRKYFIIIVVLVLSVSAISGFMFIRSLESSQEKTLNEALSRVEEIIEYNKELDYTKQVFERCSVRENASEQLLCVNRFVVENYNNVPREDVYTIDDMFDLGADCKSYSIYYATLADMLGYDYAFFKTAKHMMTIVDFYDGYCVLDQKFVECVYYE